MTEKKDASAALGSLVSDMDKFSTAAASHDVWIDGSKLEKVLNQIVLAQRQVRDLIQGGGWLVAGSYLGANPVGQNMCDKFARRNGGDQYSWSAVLATYSEQLDRAAHAISMSLRDYHGADADGAQRLNSHQ
jgi:hypothetical protein